ncbi:MAG: hypothetical protein KGZ39_04340 [Simkania sp.]|nr:hypothetical protein [Simkania sp.]
MFTSALLAGQHYPTKILFLLLLLLASLTTGVMGVWGCGVSAILLTGVAIQQGSGFFAAALCSYLLSVFTMFLLTREKSSATNVEKDLCQLTTRYPSTVSTALPSDDTSKRPLNNSVPLEKTNHFDKASDLSEPIYAGVLVEGEQNTKDLKTNISNEESGLCRTLSKDMVSELSVAPDKEVSCCEQQIVQVEKGVESTSEHLDGIALPVMADIPQTVLSWELRYVELRKQFIEKSQTLHETRKELFHLQGQWHSWQNEAKEELFRENSILHSWQKEIGILQEENDALSEENLQLQEVISSIVNKKPRASRSRTSRGRDLFSLPSLEAILK